MSRTRFDNAFNSLQAANLTVASATVGTQPLTFAAATAYGGGVATGGTVYWTGPTDVGLYLATFDITDRGSGTTGGTICQLVTVGRDQGAATIQAVGTLAQVTIGSNNVYAVTGANISLATGAASSSTAIGIYYTGTAVPTTYITPTFRKL
jgi:hypothetical protein